MPVLGRDADHVVDTRVVPVGHLGQPEVGALPGVSGNDVVDDHAVVAFGHRAELAELVLGAELGIDLQADAIEVPVN